MDKWSFKEFSKQRTLQATMKINQKKYPAKPTKFPPICCVNFTEEGIMIREIDLVTNREKDTVWASVPYSAIEKIECSPVKKTTLLICASSSRPYLNLKLELFVKNTSSLLFECEDLTVLEELPTLLGAHNIEISDPFEMIKSLNRWKREE